MRKVSLIIAIIAINLFAGGLYANAECKKKYFQFKGILSDLSFLYFEREEDGGLAVSVYTGEVFQTATICGKDSADVCLDVGGEIGPLFDIPKVLITGEVDAREWKIGRFIFRPKFKEKDIYIIDAYLKDHPDVRRFSFYYSVDHGLLAISYFGERKKDGKWESYMIETYVSTCPGFLSLE